jgi:sulfoquinovosidase
MSTVRWRRSPMPWDSAPSRFYDRPVRAPATLVVAIVLCVALASSARADVVADAGTLRADVRPDPWQLTLLGRHSKRVLSEFPGTGAGPSGTLGFRTRGSVWHHATRVVAQHGSAGGYRATLATDDPLRKIHVRVAPEGNGVIGLDARIEGPTAWIDAVGMGFRAPRRERYTGFGERSNAVDQRGNTVEDYTGEGPFQPNERRFIPAFVPNWGFRPRSDATYFPMPWLLSSSGYGVLVDGSRTSYFRLGTHRPDAWSVEVTTASRAYRESATGPPPTELSVRFFGGPEPSDVLRRLTAAIGRQPAPAPWFLGPWYQPRDDQVDALLMRRSDSPVSVAQTYTHYLPCGSQQGAEDEQRRRTAFLHSLGYAVTTYFNPMICTDYQPAYDDASGAGALTETAAGTPYVYRYNEFVVSQFDFTSPSAEPMYSSLLDEAVRHGYDGWMEDFGEYTPLDGRSAGGADGTVMHNRYPRLYHCAANRFARSRSRPILRFIRSGWTGAARCAPVVWGGDPTTGWGFDGLRSAVQNGLTMGLSGVGVWGSDIGGFFALFDRRLTPELLTRWVQFGAVSGVMRTEADGFAIPDKPRPQVFDPDQLDNWRRYAKLRTQLYPYIQAAAAAYRRNGMPIMRALMLRYPEDPRAADREDEFMFGPDLLAAPVLEPAARRRTLYLPSGRWVDLWRSVRYREADGSLRLRRAAMRRGGRDVTLPAPLRQLPLLARAGTLLPMLPPEVDTLAPYGDGKALVHLSDRRRRMELIAFPDRRSSARFLEHGTLRSKAKRGKWVLRIDDPRQRRWSLQAALGGLPDWRRPCRVTIDGGPLRGAAWSYRGRGRVLRASFEAGGRPTRLVASRRGCR